MMLWLIALGIVGLIGLLGYRYYTTPPLSKAAQQQRETYLQRFRYEKTLIYEFNPVNLQGLVDWLGDRYLQAAPGCFYGNDLTIYLRVEEGQATISLFSPNQDALTQHTWRIMKQVGGIVHAAPDG